MHFLRRKYQKYPDKKMVFYTTTSSKGIRWS
jgi:hypothetical protein